MNKKRPYKVTDHQEFTVGRFTIIKDTIRIDGKEYPYSYEKVDDSVCVLPIMGNDIILIHQYRHSFNEWFFEIPAGGVEGEDIELAAKRELSEETGCIPEKMVYIGEYPISQGTSAAKVHMFVAVCSEKKEQKLNVTELIRVCKVSRSQFSEMIESGKFNHLVGIVTWYMYQQYLEK